MGDWIQQLKQPKLRRQVLYMRLVNFQRMDHLALNADN
jgi:hypothetical protein